MPTRTNEESTGELNSAIVVQIEGQRQARTGSHETPRHVMSLNNSEMQYSD